MTSLTEIPASGIPASAAATSISPTRSQSTALDYAQHRQAPTAMITLDQLPKGSQAQVLRVKARTRSLQQRLLSMGIVEGSVVTVKGVAPLGDPLQIDTMGYLLSLRKSEAAQIEVAPL